MKPPLNPPMLDAYSRPRYVAEGCQHRLGCKCESDLLSSHDSEVWKGIPGYESLYEVSCLGRVRSLPRVGGTTSVRTYGGKVLKPFKAGLPVQYHHVSLWSGNQQVKRISVHRLILLSFVGPAPAGQEACHYNGNQFDNRLGNLRWDLRSGNEADKYRLGHGLRGERANTAKLTDEKALEIFCSIEPVIVLAERHGISRSAIDRIKHRQTWTHITAGLRDPSPIEDARAEHMRRPFDSTTTQGDR